MRLLRHCVGALTACTLHSAASRRQLIDSSPPLMPRLLQQVLLSTPANHSDDGLVVGNTALLLGHCVGHEPAAAVTQFVTSSGSRDVVAGLLELSRDQATPTARHNCAVLIARLVQAHEPYLHRLRELHGLEILHTVLKHQ